MRPPGSFLRCPSCGHDERFAAVLDDCVALVDAAGTTVRMLESTVAFYRCAACGEAVPEDALPPAYRLRAGRA